MNRIISILDSIRRKIEHEFNKNSNKMFKLNYSTQSKLIERVYISNSFIDRSFSQYLLQRKQTNIFINFIYYLGSLILIPFILIGSKKVDNRIIINSNIAVKFIKIADVRSIPEKLVITYAIIDNEINPRAKTLRMNIGLRYYHFFHPYFVLKNLLTASKTLQIIQKHKPSAILTTHENSFTSSVITLVANKFSVKTINLMHGIPLFDIRHSYSSFNEFYVWDSNFIKLYKELEVHADQFHIHYQFYVMNDFAQKQKCITYYLQLESKLELIELHKLLSLLALKGYQLKIRPHPNYSNLKFIETVFGGSKIEIELGNSIMDSLSNAGSVCSKYSTVLYHAYRNNIPIIVDDVSREGLLNKLIDQRFFVFFREVKYTRLSSLLNK